MANVVKPGEANRSNVSSINGVSGNTGADAHEFSRVRTVPWAGLHAAFATGVALYAVVAASRTHIDCASYRISVFLHVALWFTTLVVDWVLKRAQHSLRVAGYLEFYQQTYALHRAPLYVASLTSTLLLLAAPLELADGEERCKEPGIKAPVTHVALLLSADALALLFLHGRYIYQVWSFNTAEERPDVHRQNSSALTLNVSAGSHRSTLTQTADLLARQADLIRHLREHNEKLSTQLSAANSELRDLRHRDAV